MLVERNYTQSIENRIMNKVSDYNELFKLRLASLVVFSSAMGYLMAVDSFQSWTQLCLLLLGGFLIVGASNAINQLIERDSDKLMKRTANRPIAAGRMNVTEGIVSTLIVGSAGIAIIAIYMNLLSAFLGFIALISYGFIYTPLKKVHPIAVFVGAFPGALPVLIGYTAALGKITFEALLLFAIQFIWQFPHFWAIAWQLNDDYARAGIKLLPAQDQPTKSTAFQILLYTLTLIPLGIFPTVFGYTGLVSSIVATLVALWCTYLAVMLYKDCTKEAARRVMFGTFVYLPLVQIAHVVDKI